MDKRMVVRRGALLQALLLTLLVSGCGGGRGGGGGTAATILRGIVRDSLRGDNPVQDATVTVGGVTARTRTVDNANAQNPVGSFELRNVPVGANTAVVTAPNMAPQTIAFVPSVGPGLNDNIELYLNIGQVGGRILLPNGQPAANAFVTFAATAETITTNLDGTFLAQFIPAGPTELFAVLGTASVTRPLLIEYGLNGIGDVQLVDDPNPNPPGLPYTIFGRVTVTGVGTPAETAVLLFRNGVQIEATLTNSEGIYRFYVPVGEYTVRALRAGFQDAASGVLTVSDPSVPVRADLTMIPL